MPKPESIFYDTGEPPENVAAGDYFVATKGFEIVDWHPQQDGNGPAMQVHMLLPVIPGVTAVVRLKTRKAYEDFVAALKEHADRVWPVE